MALTVETDQVDLFVCVALLFAVDVLNYVGGDFYLHNQRYILNIDQQELKVIAENGLSQMSPQLCILTYYLKLQPVV